jgi:hypothetical protein
MSATTTATTAAAADMSATTTATTAAASTMAAAPPPVTTSPRCKCNALAEVRLGFPIENVEGRQTDVCDFLFAEKNLA